MNRSLLARISLCTVLLPLACSVAEAEEPKSRTFLFTYRATVTDLKPGQVARVWLPVPQTNEDQQIEIVDKHTPAPAVIGTESRYDNKILYVSAKANAAGEVPVSVTYRVMRREVKANPTDMGGMTEDLELYLRADRRVPITGKPLALLEGRDLPQDQTELGRALYDVVNNHMSYGKHGEGWGNGDSVWACDSKYGNCSDFHSLFISLARSRQVPAKFEIGFPLPPKRGKGEIPGYHCWAKFKPKGKGWVPVDISEANKRPEMKDYYFGNLTEDRVTFTAGRDLQLTPKQAGPPLNFFIYPYVEVDGKPYDKELVKRKFLFEDVK